MGDRALTFTTLPHLSCLAEMKHLTKRTPRKELLQWMSVLYAPVYDGIANYEKFIGTGAGLMKVIMFEVDVCLRCVERVPCVEVSTNSISGYFSLNLT